MHYFTAEEEGFMRQALEQAELAYAAGEIPIGAVVVCRGKVIARAHNAVERLHDPTAHAEVLAITAATEALGAKRLPDCTLYVSVEPCTMCAGAIYWARFGQVIYGAAEEKFGYRQHAPTLLPTKMQLRHGLLAEEAATLMRRFFRERRR